jgi:hypothetical protein
MKKGSISNLQGQMKELGAAKVVPRLYQYV